MQPSPWSIIGATEKAKVLLLGTFHFDESILSEKRQSEAREVVDLLAEFNPTKIAVENRPQDESRLNEWYLGYISGQHSLDNSEICQIGFSLGKKMNHQKLHCIDARGQIWEQETWEPTLKYLKERFGTEDLFDPFWNEAYTRLYMHDNKLLERQSLREHYLYVNSEERILVGHGHYLSWVDPTELGDYAIADHLSAWWYNRNLRIFANLKRITTPEDRVVLIIGSGHLALLRHSIQTSPLHELIEVGDILGF